MSFFETVSSFLSIVWSSVSNFPILNSGLVFKDVFFGFIGLGVFSFLLSRFFGFSPNFSSFRVGARSSSERISDDRFYDER